MLGKTLAIMVILGFGYLGYLMFFRFEVHKMPDVAEDQWMYLAGNFKVVVVGPEDLRPERKYLNWVSDQVPPWYKDAWAVCRLPSDEERQSFEQSVDLGPGGRFEAICEIDVDGETIVKGWLSSVPNL